MTTLQDKLFGAYKNMNYKTLEDELESNCNPIDAGMVMQLIGCSVQQANGLLVSLLNAGYVSQNGPVYMLTEKAVVAWYAMHERGETV